MFNLGESAKGPIKMDSHQTTSDGNSVQEGENAA